MRTVTRVLALSFAAVAVVAAAPLTIGPASAAPDGKVVVVRELPAKVRLAPGDQVRIVLKTNLTTGYSWKAEGGCCTKSDKQVAKVSKGVYKAPSNTNGMVGVAGTTTWTVTALRPGTTDITIVTSPPGSTNTMDDSEVGALHVVVKK